MNKQTAITVAVAAAALAVGLGIGRVRADGAPVQTPLVYAGIVSGQDGKPLAAAVEVAVTFYDAAVAGNAVCKAETVQSDAGSGRFTAVLPAECANAVHAKTDLWAETAVGPNKVTLPRQHVGAVPYALESDAAKLAKGLQCTGCVSVKAMLFDADVDLVGKTLIAGKIDFGPQAGDELTGAQVKTLTGGGNADALHTHSGLGGGGGQVIKFKGVTAAKFKGNASGVVTLDAACAQEFGAARMCTTEMLINQYPQAKPTSMAWVLQYFAMYQSPSGPPWAAPVGGGPNNCGNFNDLYAPGGTVVDVNGALAQGACNTEHPVACCGP